MKNKRILGRMLAKELSHEDLGLVNGSSDTIIVARLADGTADFGDDKSGPPISTLVATLPDYHEDQ